MNYYLEFDTQGNHIGTQMAESAPSGWHQAPDGFVLGQLCFLEQGQARLATPAEVTERTLNRARTEAIAAVKEEAGRRISMRYPDYKQRNAALGLYSQSELVTIRGYINHIRTVADDLEARIARYTREQVTNFSAASDSHWSRSST